MDIREYLENNRLFTDGAMGTLYEKMTGFQGELAERGNISHPQMIQEIHRLYMEAGAKLIRTNTFAVNSMFFDRDEELECICIAWQNAEMAVAEYKAMHQDSGDIWIAADMGPIEDSDMNPETDISAEYILLAQTFLNLGAKVFVFETLSEFDGILDAMAFIKEKEPEAWIMTQFSFNRNGYTRSGKSVKAILAEAEKNKNIDAVGFNCGVGPVHLYELLKDQAFPSGKYITALPNAGYPAELRGRAIYSKNVPYYVEQMEKIAELGIDIIGGCCGTTPEHIKGLYELLHKGVKQPKKLMPKTDRGRDSSEGIGTQSVKEFKTPFIEKLDRGEKVFVVELDPPFDANDQKLMDGAELLRDIDVDMVTIADSPLGRSRADSIASAIKMHYTVHMEAMPHICCRDKNMIALRSMLIGMHLNGLRHSLIITGDPVSRDERDSIKSVFNFNSIKLMKYLQTMNQEIFGTDPIYYGGALNHNHGSVDNIANRMQQKMEAGCSWFLTQPVYSDEDIERLRVLKEKSGGRILAGIMPLVSRKNALFIKNEMPGIFVPDEVLEQYKEGLSREEYEAIAVELSLDMIRKLDPICDGYYFMTPFNRAGLIRKIILQAKGNMNEQTGI